MLIQQFTLRAWNIEWIWKQFLRICLRGHLDRLNNPTSKLSLYHILGIEQPFSLFPVICFWNGQETKLGPQTPSHAQRPLTWQPTSTRPVQQWQRSSEHTSTVPVHGLFMILSAYLLGSWLGSLTRQQFHNLLSAMNRFQASSSGSQSDWNPILQSIYGCLNPIHQNISSVRVLVEWDWKARVPTTEFQAPEVASSADLTNCCIRHPLLTYFLSRDSQMQMEQLVMILGALMVISFLKGLGRTKVKGMERISACIVLT